jgi:hypothetical protein
MFDAGPYGADGGGLGWRDLEAWQRNVGIELEPWEGRLLRRLSGEYASMRHKAEKPDCPAPYTLVTVEAQDRVAAQFRALVAGRKAQV